MEIVIDRLTVRELATMMTLLEMLGKQPQPSELQQKFQKHMDTVRSLAAAPESSKGRQPEVQPLDYYCVDRATLEAIV